MNKDIHADKIEKTIEILVELYFEITSYDARVIRVGADNVIAFGKQKEVAILLEEMSLDSDKE